MSDLAYIESYFKGEFPPEETSRFEQRVKDDPAFAEEVAFYCSATHVIKEQVAEEKKKSFRELYNKSKTQIQKAKPSLVKKLWPYIAAAAVIAGVIFGYNIFLKQPSAQQMADNYIRQHFEVEMSITMDTKQDSLKEAIILYNKKDLPGALRLLENISQADSNAASAKKMAGIVSLRLREYDKAIEYFTQLEDLNLYSNPGKLYHALALIKRNLAGDKAEAKKLLQQVVDMDLDEKNTARKWLKSL